MNENENCENGMCRDSNEGCGCSCHKCSCDSSCGGSEENTDLETLMNAKKKAMMELLMERIKKRLDQTQKEKLDKIADVVVEISTEHTKMKKELMKKDELEQKLMELMYE